MSLLESLLAYLPPDRRKAIATGKDLPTQMEGSALWADLSGFTALTETLVAKLGPRQGADELAIHLNHIYTTIIEPVEAHGGSVIDFSGDAINCWFDADDSAKAVAAAQAMQIAFQPFEQLQLSINEKISLGIKIAIAHGPVHRFRVGDPAIQYIDVLTGMTIDHLAVIGELARTGEILLDEAIRTPYPVREWRSDPETGRRAAVLSLPEAAPAPPTNRAHFPTLSEDQIRPWLLPEVFTRIHNRQGEFLTELRPAVALFISFKGLDYEDHQVGNKLDAIVRYVQHILAEYEGTLLQLTIDNKGSYIYAAFGAPIAHENDKIRAGATALKLLLLPNTVESVQSVSIGISQGLMRTGGYGGTTRRTYGVLGEDVNLAARLMQHAEAGQILVSESMWQEDSDFRWESLPALHVKGKQTSVLPAQLLAWREQNILDLPQTTVTLPMIGRQAELSLLQEKLALTRQGQGQIVSIVGEAGLGKSRLLAEILQHVGDQTRYGGECQSYGMHSAYLVWQPIWRAFFGLDAAAPSADQIRVVEQVLTQINPDFVQRLPLLDTVLNISIPENNLTNATDVKMRKTLRETLLGECIRVHATASPLILILEDLHWSDPLSLDLLETIGRAIEDLPVLILLAYRPQAERDTDALLPGLSKLASYTSIHLAELALDETEQLIASRLRSFGLTGPIPPKLVNRLLARTQGNPFYIEELLNYQHDRGLDPRDDDIWEQGDLPDSLHSLILSRIDQLNHHQQITIKAASIIGRFFRAQWLYEYYPSLNATQIANDLKTLDHLDFIVQDSPEPQLAYLFKHVITQEVAYENLAYATRANMHELFAGYMEQIAGEDVGPFLDLLAYHYDRSDNLPKRREYLRKAGEVAQKTFANEAGLSYLDRALALTPETDYSERFALLAAREKVFHIIGKREAQKQDVMAIVELAEVLNDNQKRAQAALQLSRFHVRSDFQKTIAVAQEALKWAQLVGSNEQELNAHWLWGQALWTQGNYAEARPHYERALEIAQQSQLIQWIASILDSLGTLDLFDGNYDSAQNYLERALQLAREIGSPSKQGTGLYNLGEIAYLRGDFAKAETYYKESLDSFRLINYQLNEGRSLCRIGSMFVEQRNDYQKAALYTQQALLLAQKLNDHIGHVGALYGFSLIDLVQNHYQAARTRAEQGLQICRDIGFKYFEGMCLVNLGTVADELGEYALALEHHQHALSILREIGEPSLMSQILIELGRVFYHLGKYESALEYNQQALSIAKEKIILLETRALISQGHILRELGDLGQSLDFYQAALRLIKGSSLPDCYSKLAQTGMVNIALAQSDLTHIQAPLNEILLYLETHSLSTIDESFWIYLSCYQILKATNDTRARATLETAYTMLQNIAKQIDNEALKASFFQNVRVNREIVEAWENLASADQK